MSRGFGRWEREIMHATAGVCVAPVGGIVRAVVPEPCRDDHASARRAAKQLATKKQVSALYAWTCPRCYRVQDRSDLQVCCARPRPMLAVAQPGRRHLLAHPAPAPATAPVWVSVSAAQQPAPGLAAPTAHDLAQLASRRVWEALKAGILTVNIRDLVALMRLAAEFERDASRPDPKWQASLAEVLWTARHYLGDDWPRFAADLRSNPALLAMWPRPGPGP